MIYGSIISIIQVVYCFFHNSAQKSILGVGLFPNQDGSNGFQGNLDDVISEGSLWFAYQGDIHPQGLPNNYTNGHGGLRVFRLGERIKIQFLVDAFDNSHFWFRCKWMTNNWDAWATISSI